MLDLAVAAVLLATTLIFILEGRVLRFHDSIDTPIAPAADFLLQNHLQGRLFNNLPRWRLSHLGSLAEIAGLRRRQGA